MLRREKEHHAITAERDFDLGELHGQFARLDAPSPVLESLRLDLAVVIVLIEILFLGLANDLSRHRAGALERNQGRVLERHRADRFTLFRMDEDFISQPQPQVTRVEEELLVRAAHGDLENVGHGTDLYWESPSRGAGGQTIAHARAAA